MRAGALPAALAMALIWAAPGGAERRDLAAVQRDLNAGRLAEALAGVERLLAAEDRAEWHHLLAEIREQMNQFVEAAAEYQRAAQMDPSEQNLFDFGNHLIRHGGIEQAIQIFRYAAEQYPASVKLRTGFGVALYAGGQYGPAVEELCRAVDLAPDDPNPILFLGGMYDVVDEGRGEVTRRLEQFVTRHPDNARATYYLAMSLWGRGERSAAADTARARELLQKSLSLDPNFAEAYFGLGRMHEDEGDCVGAIRAYKETLARDARFEKAHYRLAQCYSRAGNRAKAREHEEAYRRLHGKASGSGLR